MKKYTLYIVAVFAVMLFASCNKVRTGSIEGVITEAEGKLLVLEHIVDGTTRMVDTVRLDAAGKFQFKPEVEEGPDFFCLRIDNQSMSLVIDTLLTPVKVKAVAGKLANGYEVEDEQNKELKEAVQCCNRLRRQIVNLAQSVNEGSVGVEAGRDSMAALVADYKSMVLSKFIYKNPASAASYYVLYETVNGLLVFDPNNNKDNKAFGAVATSWMTVYPNSPRTKTLEQQTLDGQRLRYAMAQRAAEQDSIFQSKLKEATYPDLELRNADDHLVSLSSLVDGKSVVLVDFNAYYLATSPAHNLVLGGIYEKYSAKGLKIYQVCLDFDENFWKTSADNLPWTTVRDEEVLYDQQGNIQYSPVVGLYNVRVLPTTYILDKEGNLVVRVEDDTQLEAELRKVLK